MRAGPFSWMSFQAASRAPARSPRSTSLGPARPRGRRGGVASEPAQPPARSGRPADGQECREPGDDGRLVLEPPVADQALGRELLGRAARTALGPRPGEAGSRGPARGSRGPAVRARRRPPRESGAGRSRIACAEPRGQADRGPGAGGRISRGSAATRARAARQAPWCRAAPSKCTGSSPAPARIDSRRAPEPGVGLGPGPVGE